jgi:putative FmdB family regulatory protein
MPFYEYKCSDCGELFTLLQKRDAERTGYPCPKCEGEQTERVFSTFASAVANTTSAACYSGGSGGGGHCCNGSCGCRH